MTAQASKHRHTWHATLYDGRWVEYTACEGHPTLTRKARMRPNGVPVALPRTSLGARVETGR